MFAVLKKVVLLPRNSQAEILERQDYRLLQTSGNSSVGRARPCQGRGREFESRFPLKSEAEFSEQREQKQSI